MSTQHHSEDQTVLAARLQRFWANFRQGKVVGYKAMAVFLILLAVVGCIWYILIQKQVANSDLWRSFQEANSVSSLEDVSKKSPNSMQDRLARLQIARYQLGVAGIDQLGSNDRRQVAIENIEKARDALKALLPDYNDDPVLKAECLLGLAKAEAALVGVPVKEGQLTEFKGSVPKVVEYLDQLSKVASDTPWGKNAAKTADALRNEQSSSEHDFVRISRELMRPLFANLGGLGEPQAPGMPPLGGFPGIKPPDIPGVPIAPPLPPKTNTPSTPLVEPIPPKAPTPGGPTPPTPGTQPTGPGGTIPTPIAPLPKAPEPKAPTNTTPPATTDGKSPPTNIPAPVAPGPKAPDTKPQAIPPPPKAGEPKGTPKQP